MVQLGCNMVNNGSKLVGLLKGQCISMEAMQS